MVAIAQNTDNRESPIEYWMFLNYQNIRWKYTPKYNKLKSENGEIK
ncbi:hypothetical protein CLV93_11284 [Prolixibacter denitrificans]|nr:hypothetical protein CLV93_11284 [Prolixibacter denitrificans]